jgi:glycosyltransferase 2 family protein
MDTECDTGAIVDKRAPWAPYRSWNFWLGLVVSLGCLVWAISALDWPAVAEALAHANLVWIGAGVVTVLVTIATRVARWAVLLQPRRLRWHNLLSAMLVGQLLNYFAPARAGDLARVYLLGYTEGESQVRTLATIALEKMWDLGALLWLVWLLSFFATLPGWLAAPTRVLALVTFPSFVLAAVAFRYRGRALAWMARTRRLLPGALHLRLLKGVEQLLDGFEGLSHPQVWLWAAVWSIATWGIGSWMNHTVLLALGLSLPLSASILLMVVLQLGVAVPSLPGRVGIYEGLCIVVLDGFGVDREAAFAAGVALHAVSFVPPIILGLFFALRVKGAKRLDTAH